MKTTAFPKSLQLLVFVTLATLLILVGCGTPEGNPLPTARPGEDVGAESKSEAQDTPEGTWEQYLRDIIAERVADRQQKLALLTRYENPKITEKNLGGLVKDIDLVEDRTAFNLTNNATHASGQVDFDIRVTFADDDTDTRTCNFWVELEKDPDDEKWYVLNPAPLNSSSVCG